MIKDIAEVEEVSPKAPEAEVIPRKALTVEIEVVEKTVLKIMVT